MAINPGSKVNFVLSAKLLNPITSNCFKYISAYYSKNMRFRVDFQAEKCFEARRFLKPRITNPAAKIPIEIV